MKTILTDLEDDSEEFPLHRAIFQDDTRGFLDQLYRQNVNRQDMHGNTALHLAVMLGRKEMINKLLEIGASAKINNKQGWNSLEEAFCYGDRDINKMVLQYSRIKSAELLASRKPYLLKLLSELGDFYLEIRYDFQSWIPFLSRWLPSDTCKIYKRGCAIRMDTTIANINQRDWSRGDFSVIYNPTCESTGKNLALMDNKKMVYQKIRQEQRYSDLEEQVTANMSLDMVAPQISTKPITFTRAMAGWFFQHEKSEDIAGFASDYYMVEGLTLVTKKRRDHLTADDVKKNKSVIKKLSTGIFPSGPEENEDHSKKGKSLPPPPPPKISWEEYKNWSDGRPPVGRTPVVKTNSKELKAVVAMSQDFPLPVSVLVDILEIVSPFKHIGKLRDFCKSKLPPGFPVYLEIPLLPTISAKITFQKFEWRNDLTAKFFTIPGAYAEDSKLYSDLF
ncbi:hypothetical protein DdX_13250 [Ditylenchus destructor]|uniref:Ankyrin repeat domain-containing protein n=1 Tax=Ditylenchus destructor TaxID=166010 RepID=A0AAD4R2Z9_9BILA|nr:hypothetical protein DdX_13250 [Ditylenchus destructor]